MARAQKGDSEPGHWAIQWRHDRKILVFRDAPGNLMRFALLSGQRIDALGVPPLIEGAKLEALIAGKAFNSDSVIAGLDARGAKAVISQYPRSTRLLVIDLERHKWHHLIENFFGKHKEFKRIAMLDKKTGRNFSAMIYLAAAVLYSR